MALNPLFKNVFFDEPPVLDASVISIPAYDQSPLQVIASHSKSTNKIHVYDGTGKSIEILVGPPGEEERVAIVGGGMPNELNTPIQQGSRVSVRSTKTQITKGTLCCQFSS